MSRREWATAVAVAAGALAAPASVSAAVRTIYAGAPPTYAKEFAALPAEVDAFFPRNTIIRVGDSVKLVTTPGYNFDIPPKGQGPVPLVTLDAKHPISATDAGGNPFWFNGTGSPGINPVQLAPQGGPTYNGTQRVTTTAFPPSQPRVVKFTKVGRYPVYCDLCYGMKGSIVVVAKKARVPSRKQYVEAVNRQVRTALAEGKKLLKSKPPKNVIEAGASGPSGIEILVMFPKTLRVKVGTVVTARMSERSVDVHTVTFGPDAYLAALIESLATGFNPVAIYPSDNPETAPPFPVNATAHGNGFANSGAMTNETRASVKFRFTQPGTYKYISLINPGMTGTVIVK